MKVPMIVDMLPVNRKFCERKLFGYRVNIERCQPIRNLDAIFARGLSCAMRHEHTCRSINQDNFMDASL